MTESFTKLFSSIITSTVWREDSDTKVVWITMLALADRHGEIQGTVPGLAHLANVSIEACQSALARFMAPDRWSRTKDDDGRRIIEIDGGWELLNYKKYRKLQSKEEQVAAASARKQRYRERKRAWTGVDTVDMSTPVHAISTEAEAEAEAEADKKKDLGAKAPVASATDGAPRITSAVDQAFRLFNDAAKRTGWPAALKIDARRRKHMQARLKDVGIDGFAMALAKAEASDFLTAKWPLKIDWLLLPANFTKVIEGNYANPPPAESHDARKDREIREAIERSKLQ